MQVEDRGLKQVKLQGKPRNSDKRQRSLKLILSDLPKLRSLIN